MTICSLVNKTFLSRPRPRPRLFSQDQGKTFYFEIETKSKTFCRSSELAAIRNITSMNAVISQNHKYTHDRLYLSHSVPRLWVNTVIIMSLASLCHHYIYAVICRLPISSLSSLSQQTSVSSVTFCKHHVTQQQVIHLGSVRPDEQNSVAEYIIQFKIE